MEKQTSKLVERLRRIRIVSATGLAVTATLLCLFHVFGRIFLVFSPGHFRQGTAILSYAALVSLAVFFLTTQWTRDNEV